MTVEQRLYTVDEFEAYIERPENVERRFELIHGEIVEKMPTEEHGIIVLRIGSRLFVFVQQHGLGYVAVEVRHQLPGEVHNARIPDISFIAGTDRVPVRTGAVPRMPDLAVEVQSPSQSDHLMIEKATYYLANGARMVWLVYPAKRLVEVLTGDDRHLLIEGDTIDGGSALPGFTMPVGEVFEA